MSRWSKSTVGALALALPVFSYAKPIAFADGTTVMAEYGAGTMKEIQIFFAPQFNYSVGGGHVELDSDESAKSRSITYARLNYLLHRWNLESAQANFFVWGGAGSGTGNTFRGAEFAANAGAQADYETRRVYGSLKIDWQGAADFSHRIDTLQLGIAPYKHNYQGLATWLVLQARDYTGELHRGTEWAALLRLFKGGAWLEAGVSYQGTFQAMTMFNF